ncbi:hypothetical protein BJ875DRAFT_487885 [Amylocarpus encephaloides]|uniref:Uncharacterized protein n=1 Tax=Amylocarpus encephaloides TaxID=45428 RepID=A0A9P7YAX0_9HELO|nr:hypothetical protein BJ875DRAFT_487885 [Amylocarpus encephaloides]
MDKSCESARLLSNNDELPDGSSTLSFPAKQSSRHLFITICMLLGLSVVLNIVHTVGFMLSSGFGVAQPLLLAKVGPHLTVQTQWLQTSRYSSRNDTERDVHWDNINYDNGLVAVPESWARDRDLPMGSVFPWDNTKRIYLINAYHAMHCLKNIYRAFMEYQESLPQSIAPEHIHHCLDQIRSDVICHADDTPRVTTSDMRPVTAECQIRTCRNWEALNAWTLANPACYRYGDPEVEDEKESQIERMKFCPEGTPELEVVRKYFNKGKEWLPAEEKLWSWFEKVPKKGV